MFWASCRDPSILAFNYSLIDFVLGHPGKCIGRWIIGITTKEFYHILPFVEAEVLLHESLHQLACLKANIRQSLYKMDGET